MRWRAAAAILTLIVVAMLVWVSLAPYRKERVKTFFNPERDPLGSGFAAVQWPPPKPPLHRRLALPAATLVVGFAAGVAFAKWRA